jgi:hypothetical protein
VSFIIPSDDDLPEHRTSSDARRTADETEVQRRTVEDELGRLPPSASQDVEAFYAAASEYLRARLLPASASGTEGVQLAILVAATHPRAEGERLQLERVRGLRYSATEPVSGRLFIVSRSLSDAYSLEAACSDPAEAFRLLAEHGLEGMPAIIADLARGTVIWCPLGTDGEDVLIDLRAEGAEEPDAEAIRSSIDAFHAEWSLAPRAHPAVWFDEESFIAAANAEERLQSVVFPVLHQRFRRSHVVRREYDVVEGRSDLSLTARTPNRGSYVIAITALRSAAPGSPGAGPLAIAAEENRRLVEQGLRDTGIYRETMTCSGILFCLFDMQRDDDGGLLVRAFEDRAGEQAVEVRRYLVPNRFRAAA